MQFDEVIIFYTLFGDTYKISISEKSINLILNN